MILKINSVKTFTRLPNLFVNRFTVNFGYIPDQTVASGVDAMFYNSPMSSSNIAGEVSLRRFFKDVSDQYHLSSCVGNAIADAFEAQQVQKLGVSPSEVKDLSRLFIYWNARNLSTPTTTDRDRGCQIRWAFDSIKRYGVPTEDVYPYVLSKVNHKPGWIPYKYAIQNKIRNFYRINASGDERIRQIIQALSSGCPVVFGARLYEYFRHINDDSVIKLNTGDKYIGGHAMCLTGWSNSKQAFELRNSWGKGWGKEGYGFIDVNYIKSSEARDFWVATL